MNAYCRAHFHFLFIDTDIPVVIAWGVTARCPGTMNAAHDCSVSPLSLFIHILLCNCFNSSGCIVPSAFRHFYVSDYTIVSFKQTHYTYCRSGLNMNKCEGQLL